jgi:hypothetical protein
MLFNFLFRSLRYVNSYVVLPQTDPVNHYKPVMQAMLALIFRNPREVVPPKVD